MMDELVVKIMDIEKRANLLVDNEQLKMAGLNGEVEHLYLEKKRQLEERKKNRLDLVTEQEKADEEQRIAAFNAEFDRAVGKIHEVMDANKEKWIGEIYNKIIS